MRTIGGNIMVLPQGCWVSHPCVIELCGSRPWSGLIIPNVSPAAQPSCTRGRINGALAIVTMAATPQTGNDVAQTAKRQRRPCVCHGVEAENCIAKHTRCRRIDIVPEEAALPSGLPCMGCEEEKHSLGS
ncbi:hypothetical protein NDU88_004334 [Pleurodeles waltl]|uniref:Uncharacterized protein n=1 Tax=Pleurodeles waltl TaxID=8319 RepID=A0AAV7MGC5_PLEWA|nr:hypothetical protein NDU88_004334 [Pleurodeles waltl]